jgi:DMSO/TMAO reductase YedYZ molybdopterin-dependent catalytic subunit
MEEYEQLTYPITLVCAGNRRKEQNIVRKSKGFSWGAAGVSTALWTGVAMSEVIRRARPKRNARYVCMEGADKLVLLTINILFSIMLTQQAKWILRDMRKVKLGYGSK